MSAQVSAPVYRHRTRPPKAPEPEPVASSSRLRSPNGLVSPSHSTTSLRTSAISPTPSAETFDAFVQAADPRHPDHTAWLERYSSSSSRPSRQSSTQTRTSIDRRRRTPTTQVRETDENGSDADDPLDDDKGWGEQEHYFKQGSVRSHHSSSTASTQQRRRARSNRDKTKPKPLQPPTPPPRISSSINWQSAYGSPSIPESHEVVGAPPSYGHVSPVVNGISHSASVNEATEPSRVYASETAASHDAMPLSSIPPSRDNMIAVSQPDEKRFFKLPRSLFNARRPSGAENDKVVPSPASTQSFASQRVSYDQAPRKSFSRIRQVLGADTSKPLPSKPEEAAPRKSTSHLQDRTLQPVIATQRSSKSIPRVPPPTLSQLELVENGRSVDAEQTLDLEAFPLRLDNEFRENANEFEMSEDEPDDGLGPEEIRLPWVSTSFTPHVHVVTRPPVRTAVRSPGVVRRSLDSIVSPFRAGLLAQASAQGAANRGERQHSDSVQQEAPSRRSLSESRFVRPFLPRPRQGSVAGRPLSVVADQPDGEARDAVSPLSTLPVSQSVPAHLAPTVQSTLASSPHAIAEEPSYDARASVDTRRPSLWKRSQRASMDTSRAGSTGRSLQNSFSRSSTQVNHVKASTDPTPPPPDLPASQSRRKLSSFLSKMRGSMSSSKLPTAPEPTQPINGTETATAPVPVGRMSLDAVKLPRSRSRSFASKGRTPSFSRQEDPIPAIPEYPTSTSAERLSQHDEPWRRQLLTSAVSMSLNGVHTTPPPAADNIERRPSEAASDQLHEPPSKTASASRSSQSLGRLWRRRPTREDIEVVQQTPAPTAAVDIATPRSSMSSARGFDLTPTDDVASANGPVRLTIRKTLSPAIINEKAPPVSEGPTFSAMRRSRSEPFAASSDQEELDELDDDEHAFRSPLGRFIRGNIANDRLSRVEETGERQSASGSQTLRAPSSPRSGSLGEHSMRRSLSGDVRSRAAPAVFDETDTFSRLRNYSMDVSRRPVVTTPEPVSALSAPPEEGSPATDGQPFKSSSAGHSNGYVAPTSTAFLSRSSRSSFSQDRDRTPVASPISVPLANNRGMGQALQILRGKGKNKGGVGKGKGVGPPDVVVLGLPDDDDEPVDRPLDLSDALRRPSVGTSTSHTFAGANASSKRLDNAVLPPSLTTPLETKPPAPGQRNSAGLGLGSFDFHDSSAAHTRTDGWEGSLMTSTTSEGTFSTLGAQTPESQSQGPHVAHLPPVGTTQQPDLRAFDAMLGSFPQQEKVLLRDISARAMEHRKTPMASNDDLHSISTKQPDHGLLPSPARSDLHVSPGTTSVASVASLD